MFELACCEQLPSTSLPPPAAFPSLPFPLSFPGNISRMISCEKQDCFYLCLSACKFLRHTWTTLLFREEMPGGPWLTKPRQHAAPSIGVYLEADHTLGFAWASPMWVAWDLLMAFWAVAAHGWHVVSAATPPLTGVLALTRLSSCILF